MKRADSSHDDQKLKREFALNGLSVHSVELNQDGELEVVFDLPYEQTTAQYYVNLRGTRTLNVYDDAELLEACKRLFDRARELVMEPDPDREGIHCDRCSTSACCRKYNALVTEEDIERVAAGIGISPEEARERYMVAPMDWSGDYTAQLAADTDEQDGEEKCVFLKRASHGQLRCSIYEHRPRICRDFDMTSCDDFEPIKEIAVLGGKGNKKKGSREAG